MNQEEQEPSIEVLESSWISMNITKRPGNDNPWLDVKAPATLTRGQAIRAALLYMSMADKEFYKEVLNVASLILTRNLDEILGLQDNNEMYDILGSQLSKVLTLFVQDSQHILKAALSLTWTRLENDRLEEHALVAALMQQGDAITENYEPIYRCIHNDPILQNGVRLLLNKIDNEPE